METNSFIIWCFLLLATGTIAWALFRTFIQPLRKISVAVDALTAGRMDYRIALNNRAETGGLTGGFNRMAETLAERHLALERQAEARSNELAYLANHDSLTGLVNRAGLLQALDDAVRTARRRGMRFALLLMDLDGFKGVNDSLGHDQGDILLQEVARRLLAQVRDVDTVARLGGDEFCILLTDIDNYLGAAEIAARSIEAIANAVPLHGMIIAPRGSIGIAIYPDDSDEPGVLLKAADTAMYAAKRGGKHRYALYQQRMTQEVEHELALATALHVAFERNEFELHYQPLISLDNGRMVAVEALTRWRHPERGLVPPDEFIAVVTRIGLIGRLGEWVLQTACQQAVAWHENGLSDLKMCVNISAGHFESLGFVDTVTAALRDSSIAPHFLEIEVTESTTRNPVLHAAVSSALRGMGVSIAIDDFGTGYSSLAVLKDLPINTLKLDRQFISDMLNDAKSSVLIGAIMGMARGLGYEVVAEGVETREQMQVLIGLGCPVAQGYLFSRPVIASHIPPLAERDFRIPLTGILTRDNHNAPASEYL